MTSPLLRSLACSFAWLALACGNAPSAAPRSVSAATVDSTKTNTVVATLPHVEILDPEALRVIDSGAEIRSLDTGFAWTEGPLYIAGGDYFLYSDIPNNVVYRWAEGMPRTVYLKPSGNTGAPSASHEPGSNGLLLDPAGRLVLCQQGDRRMGRMKSTLADPKPAFDSLASRFEGKRFNSPNDGVYRGRDLFFTDPFYGLTKGVDDPAKELPYQGVYCLKPGGRLSLVTKELKCPNGIVFSPDGRNMFIANSDPDNEVIMKYAVDESGRITGKSLFHQVTAAERTAPGGVDGMKMTRSGYLFSTAPGGVWIFNPTGKVIAKILTGEITANCAFSSDEKRLFMTCNHMIKLCRLKR